MGTGEIGRYLGTHGAHRVAKAVFLGSLEPFLLQTAENPDGVPQSVFDPLLAGVKADRYAFFGQFFAGFFNTDEFLGNRLSQEALDANLQLAYNASPYASVWAQPTWLTDFRADIEKIDLPSMIVHGTADNILPIDATGRRFAKALPFAKYIEIEGAPHGMMWTHAAEVNKILLDFLAT